MATSYTSGKIWSTNGYDRCMYATCSQTKGTSSQNKSTVSWTLTVAGDTGTYYDTGPTTLTIGGIIRYSKPRTGWSSGTFPARAGSVSGSFTVNHNTDGSVGGIKVELSTAILTGTVSSTSGTWNMDPIARYFSSTPTITLSNKTETDMTFDWKTSETCNKITAYYKKSTDSNYSSAILYEDSTGSESGSFTLSNLSENIAYNIYIEAIRKDSGLASNSATSTITTHSYPYISAVEKTILTIGDTQKLTIYNPLKRSIIIKMYKTNKDGTVLYTSDAITEESLTFTPSASSLYASIPNMQSSYCVYSVFYSDSSSEKITTENTYSYKIKGDENPVFVDSQVSTYDASSAVTAITGQTAANGWLVQSLSKMKLTINSAATAKNNATISNYKVIFNKIEKILTVGTEGATWDELNASGIQVATIVVTDSRGLTTTINKNITYIPYKVPSITLSGGRQNNYGTIVDLSVSYNSSSVNNKNTITVTWSGAGQSGTFITAGTAAGNGTKTATINNVDNNTAYSFVATITDKFGKTSTSTLPISIGMPIFFVDSEQLGAGVNTFPRGQGLWVDGKGSFTGNLTAQEIKTVRLGASSNVVTYVTFAKLPKSNDTGKTAMTLLFSSLGKFGGTIPGTCLVTISNRESKPTLRATWLQKSNSGTVKFGYYSDDDYFYFGVYADTYSYSRDIILLSYDVESYVPTIEIKNYSTSSTAPEGWTEVIPTYPDAYPVGAIYLSYENVSPASLFGGTWQQISGDYYLMLSNGVGTGGSNSITYTPEGTVEEHTLTIDEIPRHRHGINNSGWNVNNGEVDRIRYEQIADDGKTAVYTDYTGGDLPHSHGFSGTTATISIEPKYYKVYAWRRIS